MYILVGTIVMINPSLGTPADFKRHTYFTKRSCLPCYRMYICTYIHIIIYLGNYCRNKGLLAVLMLCGFGSAKGHKVRIAQ